MDLPRSVLKVYYLSLALYNTYVGRYFDFTLAHDIDAAFHEEIERPNPSVDLEQKLQATKAAAEKQIQALTKERDTLKASEAGLRAEISTAASNFDQLKLENAKVSEEKKQIQVALSIAQEEATSLKEENKLLARVRDQLSADKSLLEADNDRFKAEVEEQSRLISSRGYMAFASCLKQVEFLNPGVQITFKGVHPLHEVEGGQLLDYDNDPPTQVNLDDPELEAFDPHADYSMSPPAAEDENVALAKP
jgi:FtsZ-binding cell division protein ZapB